MSKIRQKQKGAKYYIKNRFHPFFFKFSKRKVRARLIEIIKKAMKLYKFRYDNICVTREEFYMTIEPLDDEDISEIMKWIKQVFTQWFNRMFNPDGGTVWKGRFVSRIIRDLIDFIRTFDDIVYRGVRSGLHFALETRPIYEEWDEKSMKC